MIVYQEEEQSDSEQMLPQGISFSRGHYSKKVH